MATCMRCGKRKIRKRKDGRKKCARCGFLPGDQHFSRDGDKIVEDRNNG